MSNRVALVLAFTAIAICIPSLIVMADQLNSLKRRIIAIENRPLPATPPLPPPEPPPESKESRQAAERLKIREMTDKESQDHLDLLLQKLELEPAAEAQVREAFTPEFDFYAEGVVRVLESLKGGSPPSDENWLESPEFRKGLGDRIAAADEKVRPLLDPARTAKFDEWRKDFRKSRYELD